MSVVYTGGTFDIPHFGHTRLLLNCRKIAGKNGKVIVALNTDEFVERYKGKPPIVTYQERKNILESLRYVDKVIPNEQGEDSRPTILKAKPDFIVIGSDWATKDYYTQMGFTQEWLDENNITLCYVPYTKGVSTTTLKERLR